ncbi:MAG: hypothetical protein OK436_03130 [Thaumarchaeota archaeon]|nr:hypothetical protein [Nitrososphaerota archaeon]
MLAEDRALAACSAIGALMIASGDPLLAHYGPIVLGLGGILKAVWPQNGTLKSADATPVKEGPA